MVLDVPFRDSRSFSGFGWILVISRQIRHKFQNLDLAIGSEGNRALGVDAAYIVLCQYVF